jgi:hypothetical protein
VARPVLELVLNQHECRHALCGRRDGDVAVGLERVVSAVGSARSGGSLRERGLDEKRSSNDRAKYREYFFHACILLKRHHNVR